MDSSMLFISNIAIQLLGVYHTVEVTYIITYVITDLEYPCFGHNIHNFISFVLFCTSSSTWISNSAHLTFDQNFNMTQTSQW